MLLISVSLCSFLLMNASPIDPLSANVGQAALGQMSREHIEKLESYWGSKEPPVKRFITWGKDFISGDMGISLIYKRPVSKIIAERLKNSFILMLTAWIISGVIGFILGCISGMNEGKLIDKIIKCYCLIVSSAPVFYLAMILLLVFSVWLKVLPIGFFAPIGVKSEDVTLMDMLHHAVLPAVTLSITGVSSVAIHTREKMIDIMESDFVLFAAARGESRWQIFKNHCFRNVLAPAIMLQFAQISEIFGGSVIVEQVFSYPGLGNIAVNAGLGSDLPLLLAITVISAAIVFFGNLAADTVQHIVDPTIRRGGLNNVSILE